MESQDPRAKATRTVNAKIGFTIHLAAYVVVSGEGGIRTRGELTPTPVFETGPFGRSGTSPGRSEPLIFLCHWRKTVQNTLLCPFTANSDAAEFDFGSRSSFLNAVFWHVTCLTLKVDSQK